MSDGSSALRSPWLSACLLERYQQDPTDRFPAASAWVDALALVRLRLVWVATTPVRFRQNPTDTLWAALGARLHERDPHLYARLFKPALAQGGAPSPFALAALAPNRRTASPGDELAYDLTLVGWAGAHVASLTEAARDLETTGLGTGRNAGFGSLALSRIATLDATSRAALYFDRSVGGAPCPVAPLSGLHIGEACRILPGNALALRFDVPVHLKHRGHLAEPTLPLLLRRLGWRVRELIRLHGTGGELPDFRPLLRAAAGVTARFEGPPPLHGQRYSRRRAEAPGQRAAIPTSGYVGTLTLCGDMAPLLPLLVVGQWLHVGKNTERGYGHYRIEPLVPSASTIS